VRTWALPIFLIYINDGFVSAENEDGQDALKIPRKFMIWQKGYMPTASPVLVSLFIGCSTF
jgi:hypothetical protein